MEADMRSIITIILTMAGTALLSGCAMTQRAMPSTMSDANVVSVLNTIDKTEIDAGQMAKQKASSSDVRSFAAHIVDDHMTMTEKHRRLVEQLNIQPEKPRLASALQGTHEEAMKELQTKSGSDFDRAYIEYQIKMHEQAIKLVEDTAESADNAQLKRHLMQAKPDLQSHLSAAKTLNRQLAQR
jgi:putative membrane protein